MLYRRMGPRVSRGGGRRHCRNPNRQRWADTIIHSLLTNKLYFPSSRNLETCTALGARVIAAASPNKLDVARVAGGADVVVDYTTDGWQKYVMHITGGRGVDIVYDPVGKIKGLSPLPKKRKGESALTRRNIDGFCRCAQVYCMGWARACCRLCGWCDRAGTRAFTLET
jgi:hypothetical protein